MRHPMNDGILDVLVLGPMGPGTGAEAGHCLLLKAALERLLAEAPLHAALAASGWHSVSVTAPEHLQGNRIANEVFRQLDRADLVVLDLSSRPGTTSPSPNVMYELALVHALGLPFMLITRTPDAAPFYVAHDRVHQADYADPAAVQDVLRGPFTALLDPRDRQNFADNAVSAFYDGAAILDISAAAGLAAGYYDNFVHRVLREGNGYLARSGGRFTRLITVLPEHLDSTAAQQLETLARTVGELGLSLETSELKLADADIRGLAIRHVGPVIVDLPSTVYALRRSPRMLRHLQAPRDDADDGLQDAERKTHQRLLRQFRQGLLDYLRRDRALMEMRDRAFECVTLAELPARLRAALPG